MASVDSASSWPAVVGNALDKVPAEHFGIAFWVLLGGVLVLGIPFVRKLLMPAQSASETEAAVTRGVSKAINGDLKEIRAEMANITRQMTRVDNHVGLLEHIVEKNRQAAKGWHEENTERLDKYDRVIDRFRPWDKTTERRQR